MSKAEKEDTPEVKTDVFSDIVANSRPLAEIAASERILTSLEPRKPKKDEFFRCHPELHATLNIYRDETNRVEYVLHDKVAPTVEALVGVRRVSLRLAANYCGDFFAWPVSIPADVKANRWHATAYQAMEQSIGSWIRLMPSSGHYIIYRREVNDAKDPTWPDEIRTDVDLARFAYGTGGAGDYIESLNHEVIKRLKGEI